MKLGLSLVPVLLLPPLALAACAETDTPTQPPLVRTVLPGTVGESAQARLTGTVRSRIEADLGFRVPGKIVARLVDPGTVVRQGQPLLRIDASDLALSAQAARDRLAAARAEDERARAEEARLRELVEGGATSRSAYEAALAARRAAAANLSAAQASASEASNQRSYSVLTADADGVVIDVLAQPGQVVAAGTPVVRLARSGPREAAVAVPETLLASLPRQATATLLGPGRPIGAKLREIAGSADPATRTFAARYALDAPSSQLPLGSTVTLALASMAAANRVAVPLSALNDDGKGPAIWTVGTNGIVRKRPVKVIRLFDETALIAGLSLARGERIVAMGAHLLRDGQRVRIESSAR